MSIVQPIEPGPAISSGKAVPVAPHAAPDPELELGRLARLRAELDAADCSAGIFYDPTNIRYATGTSNMSVYSLHNPCRYVFVPVGGEVVLFDFKGCEHLSIGHPAVDEVRTATSWYHFVNGYRTPEFASRWADEIVALLGPGDHRVAVDRLDFHGVDQLRSRGVSIADGQEPVNRARLIKTAEEQAVIRQAMAACEGGIAAMADALRPGITERELWSVLHAENIAAGGEWFETRLLTSGPRTNPWYQECSDRVIEQGDLVAFDTDLIGIGGYSIDISRTWVCGEVAPTANQRRLHDAARAQIASTIDAIKPGAGFADLSARSQLPPEGLHSMTNACVAHGVGLCNEYPLILNRDWWDTDGYDGEIRPGMVLCVESLVAPPGGPEAVKLEEQVLVNDTGAEVLSSYPLDL